MPFCDVSVVLLLISAVLFVESVFPPAMVLPLSLPHAARVSTITSARINANIFFILGSSVYKLSNNRVKILYKNILQLQIISVKIPPIPTICNNCNV